MREDSSGTQVGGILRCVDISPFLVGGTGMDLGETICDEGGKMGDVVADLFDNDFRIRPEEHLREFRREIFFDFISHLHRPDGGDEFQTWDAVVVRGARGVEGDDGRLPFDEGDHRLNSWSPPDAVRHASITSC